MSRDADLVVLLCLSLAAILGRALHRALVVPILAARHLRLWRHRRIGDAVRPDRRRHRGEEHQDKANGQRAQRHNLIVLGRNCQVKWRLSWVRYRWSNFSHKCLIRIHDVALLVGTVTQPDGRPNINP